MSLNRMYNLHMQMPKMTESVSRLLPHYPTRRGGQLYKQRNVTRLKGAVEFVPPEQWGRDRCIYKKIN